MTPSSSGRTGAGRRAGSRWAVASRLLAATAGGYLVAASASAALALWLPRLSELSRAQGVLLATLLSFVAYALLALGVFCVRSAWRAWLYLGLAGAASAGALWLGLHGGRF